jgi:hypothetical protein
MHLAVKSGNTVEKKGRRWGKNRIQDSGFRIQKSGFRNHKSDSRQKAGVAQVPLSGPAALQRQ